MKVQCDVCEKAAAILVCCADEAALCAECDKQVHAANKLAEKHERVPFLGHQPSPCDICQDKMGHFFCVEHRALLCRDCDMSVHTANKLVEKHKRFLVMGMRVGLQAMAAPQPMPTPTASPQPLGICKSPKALSIATETAQLQSRSLSNPQEAMWQMTPPPKANVMQSIHAPPTLSPHIQVAAPHPSSATVNLPNCLLQPDELLNINAATAVTETPSWMSIPSLGWNMPNIDALASWDIAANLSSPYVFEESLAEVPSTPSPSIKDQALLKRKRSIDSYDGLDCSPLSQVPRNYFFPSFKDGKISFYGGGGK